MLTSVLLFASVTATPSWWRDGIVYQVYPRSFRDGCVPSCSGNGTLVGITNRIEYLNDLGVSAIWISPIYPSPMRDFGYDISNYEDIWPGYGA